MNDIGSVQNQYSVTERKHEDVLEYCTRAGLAFISWFPLRDSGDLFPDKPRKHAKWEQRYAHGIAALTRY